MFLAAFDFFVRVFTVENYNIKNELKPGPSVDRSLTILTQIKLWEFWKVVSMTHIGHTPVEKS